MSLFWIPVLLVIGVFVPLITERLGRTACAFFTMLAPALALTQIAGLLPRVLSGEVVTQSLAWIPAAGLTLSMRLDGWR